ncbi:MAG: DUF1592 domain-containing protein [Planctomycetaceae bacterium]|nr:DUF1592 domain-containing protein [Planctomycetaceae bacterium]
MTHLPRVVSAILTVVLVASSSTFAADDLKRGEAIYREMCASCHGAKGEGSKDYKEPLLGDASLVELSRVIDKTMPEGEPEKCVGDDARNVAAYIYEAFYSPEAQVRNTPARVELSRLTVRQYRETLADLIGQFRGDPEIKPGNGLNAEYFETRRFRRDDRKVDRVDSVVRFNFGEEAPVPDVGINAKDFSIRWSGSVIPPESGEYEFIVKTANGVQLWVNDDRTPLIDGRVRSGNEVEHRERISLLAGRRYRLRLELFKSDNAKEKNAAIELWWRIPHRTEELLATRYLVPSWAPETFVVTTPFPPDDRSIGYERGTAVSKEWDQATTDAAFETAAYVLRKIDDLAGTKRDAGDRVDKLKSFSRRFIEFAFRRPLADAEVPTLIDAHFAEAESPEQAVQRVVLLTLKSPRFLYRELGGEPNDAWNIASRMSYALWDSLPDKRLRESAAVGKLTNDDEIREQAYRMANNPRASAKLREFLRQWLRLDHITDLAKDSSAYPDFTPEIASDLRTSLDIFLDDVLAEEKPSLNRLLMEERVWLNERLAAFYGVELPPVAEGEAAPEFRPVVLDPGRRAGVLTHPYLMASFAYTATSSPIHRGVFLSRSVLGRALKIPQIAVSPIPPDLHPDLTTRERVALQTEPEACRSCHNLINPLGFTLEQFDAVGRYRDIEKGKPIDSQGGYLTRRGEDLKFDGSRALAQYLAASPEVEASFTRQLFAYMVKQAWSAWGAATLDELQTDFHQSGDDLRRLTAKIAMRAAKVPGK